MEIVDEGMITTGDDWLRCLAGRMKCRPLACLDFRFFFSGRKRLETSICVVEARQTSALWETWLRSAS